MNFALADWFRSVARSFPWRENRTPYAVWVSEVMLQQTRASVVVPYFQRWMNRFPTVEALAAGKIEEVIKLWEGLGYYSRARSLHEGAKFFTENYGGEIPADPKVLQQVKGLGPYTIGAILSFAYQQKAPAVDGNVLRVMSRLFCIEEEIDSSRVRKQIEEKVVAFLPDTEAWVIMEAIIELGALVCTKKPACHACPLMGNCLGYARGKVGELPKKKKGPQITVLKREVFVIHHGRELLLQKQTGKKVMADLYEFPYFAKGESWDGPFFQRLTKRKQLAQVEHTFTRYRAQLFPSIWEADNKMEIEGFHWVEQSGIDSLPFSSGHRKIVRQLDAYFTH